MNRLTLMIFFLFLSGQSVAADCKLASTTCIDTTASKTISGIVVTLADAGGCWQYQDVYTCLKPNAIDYCAAFRQVPTCAQMDSTCSLNDTLFNTGCMEWTNTWRCAKGMSTPANTVVLGDTYTIATDTINNAQCQTYTDNPTCTLAAHVCTDPAATRNINGLDVYKDCWAWQDTYTCAGVTQNDCQSLLDRGCTLQTSTCMKTAANGQCSLTEKVYQCQSSPGSTTTTLNCGSQQYCMGNNCFNTGHVPDADLAKTAAMMEMMRQSGNYQDPAQQLIFGGQGSSCTKTLFGLFNCCKASAGGTNMKNSSVMGFAVQQGLSAGGQALKYGSSYVYDTLFDSSFIVRGLDSALSSTPIGSLAGGSSMGFSPSFGLYGFTATFGAPAAGATVLGSAGGITFAFDPYSLMIAVAIMVIQDLMSCTQDEKMLGMKKGENLCRYTGSYCSAEVPILGICLQVTENYCCFNSHLARIINTAGGAQLGRTASNCTGFTADEFALLDFSRIDLSEFTNEIMANVRTPSATTVGNDNGATLQQKLNNYYTRGKQ